MTGDETYVLDTLDDDCLYLPLRGEVTSESLRAAYAEQFDGEEAVFSIVSSHPRGTFFVRYNGRMGVLFPNEVCEDEDFCEALSNEARSET